MPPHRADSRTRQSGFAVAYDALPCPDLADRLARVYAWATEAARIAEAQNDDVRMPSDADEKRAVPPLAGDSGTEMAKHLYDQHPDRGLLEAVSG